MLGEASTAGLSELHGESPRASFFSCACLRAHRFSRVVGPLLGGVRYILNRKLPHRIDNSVSLGPHRSRILEMVSRPYLGILSSSKNQLPGVSGSTCMVYPVPKNHLLIILLL